VTSQQQPPPAAAASIDIQVCVQLPTSANSVALPAFALSASRAPVDRQLLPAAGPTAANLQQLPWAMLGQTDRQTSGHCTVT